MEREDFKDPVGQLKASRLQAMVLYMNKWFVARLQQYGHKYTFEGRGVSSLDSDKKMKNQQCLSGFRMYLLLLKVKAKGPKVRHPARHQGTHCSRKKTRFGMVRAKTRTNARSEARLKLQYPYHRRALLGAIQKTLLRNKSKRSRSSVLVQDVYACLSSSNINNEQSQAELKKIIADKKL